MAIDAENIRWASEDEIDPLTGLPNKQDPPAEVKSSGAKNNQPIARQWLNNQFNEISKACEELQSQVDAIVGGSSQPTLQAIYPVNGQPYLSFLPTDPATVLGFGTWVKIEGKVLIGVDESDTDFDTPNKNGGSKDHSHNDNLTVDGTSLTENQLPSHSHPYTDRYYIEKSSDPDIIAAPNKETTPVGYNGNVGSGNTDTDNNTWLTYDTDTDTTGSGDAHTHSLSGGVQSSSNLMPYETLYMWRRTA